MNSHNPMNIAADFAKATGGTARKVVALTDKGPLNGFKKFLSRGSMISSTQKASAVRKGERSFCSRSSISAILASLSSAAETSAA